MMASDLLIWYYNENQFNLLASLSIPILLHILMSYPVLKICKDKVEAEAWFTGLSALVSPGQHGSQAQHIDGIRNAGHSFDVNSYASTKFTSVHIFSRQCLITLIVYISYY
jgi:hypothetical protein